MDELLEFKRNALRGALAEPLCKEYKMEWMAAGVDKEKLVALAMRQQSIPYFAHYCHMGYGLSKEYIINEFGEYINGYAIMDADDVIGYTYGLYVGYDYDNAIVIDKDVSHIMWTIDANIVVPKTKCPIIYISNNSNVSLIGDGFNSVTVYLFDKSKLTISDTDSESDIKVYKYSDECVVEQDKYCLGKVKEFKKDLRL